MQCPHCGKTINEVIDSRPTKGEIAIRRRRQWKGRRGQIFPFDKWPYCTNVDLWPDQ